MHKINFTFIWLILFNSVLTHGQWVQSDGPSEAHIQTLYQNGATLWVGIDGYGLYRSKDKGKAWKTVGKELDSRNITAITASGANLLVGIDYGVYRSQDDGQNWQLVLKGDPYITIKCLLSHGGEVYAGTDSGKIYSSEDSGTTWKVTVLGVTNLSINALASSGSSIIAGTSQGLLISNDKGISWAGVDSTFNLAGPINCIATSENEVYVGSKGIYRSPDNGKNWTLITRGASFDTVGDFSALTIRGNSLFAGTKGGLLYRTDDNGKNWVFVGSAMIHSGITAITPIDSTLFVGTNDIGLIETTDGGKLWSWCAGGLPHARVNAIAIPRFGLGIRMFVGTVRGFYTIHDKREISAPTVYGAPFQDIHAFYLDSTGIFLLGKGVGVLRSTNYGQNWYSADSGIKYGRIQSFASLGGEIFAATYADFDVAPYRGGVYRTRDQGISWTQSNSGLPSTMIAYTFLTKGDTLFVGGLEGLYKSTDHANTWQAADSGLSTGGVNAIAVLGKRMFAGTDQGVCVSTNSGADWNKANDPSPYNAIRSLIVVDNILFAGTWGGGVMRYLESSNIWIPANQGLESGIIHSLTINHDTLFAATENGIWYRPKSEAVGLFSNRKVSRVNAPASGSARKVGNKILYNREYSGSAKPVFWNTLGRKTAPSSNR